MIYRACVRLVSAATRSDTCLLRASVHSSVFQQAKKNTDTPSAPAKGNPTAAPKGSSSTGTAESYQSGEVFYSHNAYSFYDAEIDMEKDRLKQISSQEEKKPLGGK